MNIRNKILLIAIVIGIVGCVLSMLLGIMWTIVLSSSVVAISILLIEI